MTDKSKIRLLIQAFGVVTGFVILQQLAAKILFGVTVEWTSVPQFALINMGIVGVWFFIKNPDLKIPAFIASIAAICLVASLRAALFHVSLFRFVFPIVVAFLEKQLGVVLYIVTAPQFIPTAFAALVLLLLLPRMKTVYRRLISN